MRLSRVLVAGFCRVRISGDIPDKLRQGPLLLAGNHIGTFDPFVLIAACARTGLAPRIMASRGLFTTPVFGTLMRRSGHIRVDRGAHTVTEALHFATEALEEGSTIAAYPEGRITMDPLMWPERGKTGVARLALLTGAPVVIVAQWGAHEVTTWDQPGTMVARLISALWRRPIARVHFGATVDLSGLTMEGPGHVREAADRITAATFAELRALRADEPGLPRYLDPVRPLSTARSFRAAERETTYDAHSGR
ncbi:1-acyl-sn-glycerol-3-phosphate acyltransferase [Phytomonospora endophytica]|nr:1-acyl-sn-glycerol-3-phosphate acyltransferase [Phytomonospora endophytica]